MKVLDSENTYPDLRDHVAGRGGFSRRREGGGGGDEEDGVPHVADLRFGKVLSEMEDEGGD